MDHFRRIFERVMNGTRTMLGEEAFAQIWEESQSTTLEEMMTYVRED